MGKRSDWKQWKKGLRVNRGPDYSGVSDSRKWRALRRRKPPELIRPKIQFTPLGQVILTKDILDYLCSANGGWPKFAIGLLDVPYPLKKGWKKRLIGKIVSLQIINALLNGKITKPIIKLPKLDPKVFLKPSLRGPLPKPSVASQTDVLPPVRVKKEITRADGKPLNAHP